MELFRLLILLFPLPRATREDVLGQRLFDLEVGGLFMVFGPSPY